MIKNCKSCSKDNTIDEFSSNEDGPNAVYCSCGNLLCFINKDEFIQKKYRWHFLASVKAADEAIP